MSGRFFFAAWDQALWQPRVSDTKSQIPIGVFSPPPLLPEARPQNHSLRGSRSPPSWSGSRSAAAAGQELVALRAALAELRCWAVELAEGSRRPWGRLLLPARCCGS